MASLEDRINELCKSSMLMSPIWLARLIEEIFEASWIKRQSSGALSPDNNTWPLVPFTNISNQYHHTTWSSSSRSKNEVSTVSRFLSPQGVLFTALRQSADAWVSVSFDAKLAQSDSVRIATGIATIMRQPKLATTDMPYRPQSARSFNSQNATDQTCMITLPVPHYFVLRLVAYLMCSDVTDTLNNKAPESGNHFLSSGNKFSSIPVPSCVYSDLIDEYCEFLLTNARQPPGSTVANSRSLCADLARLYIQAVSDFWLAPYASPIDSSSLSFSTSISLPPPVLLHFVRRFLKRYFVNAADEWNCQSSVGSRQTTFASLKQPLFAFLVSCATHWPLNTSFGNVVSCWRAVALPWHAVKAFGSNQTLTVWESFVQENFIFYSETLVVPLSMHLARANVACPAYASALIRMAKVFGGAPDTECLVVLLHRISNSIVPSNSAWNASYNAVTPGLGASRASNVHFNFTGSSSCSAIKQLLTIIDTTLASSCSGSSKEALRSAKSILVRAFFNGTVDDSFAGNLNESLNKTPAYSGSFNSERNKSSGGRLPKFRTLPHRQQSISSFALGDNKLFEGEPDYRSADIPIILKLQSFISNIVESKGLLPKTGKVGFLCQNARLRWMADRRELAVMVIFLMLSYVMCSSPVFFCLAMLYFMFRTFLLAIVTHFQETSAGSSVNSNLLSSSPPAMSDNQEGIHTE